MTTPQIIAHRGASYLAPENTLVAFRKAMEIGADGVEMDVQKTYDNELVIHHDYMVDMHTDISGQIYDLTMGELKTLDLAAGKMHLRQREDRHAAGSAGALRRHGGHAGAAGTEKPTAGRPRLCAPGAGCGPAPPGSPTGSPSSPSTTPSCAGKAADARAEGRRADLRRFPQHGAASAGGVEGSGPCEQHG